MPTISTLGRRPTEFTYTGDIQSGVTLQFESGKPTISPEFFSTILGEFQGKTIPGGFSMTDPTPGGFGEWVQKNARRFNKVTLSPRHASFIAATLAENGYITSSLKGNAVYLHFLKRK